MSVVTDHVRRLDAQIDRISLVHLSSEDADVEEQALGDVHAALTAKTLSSPRVNDLLRIVKALSNSNSGSLLQSSNIQSLLTQSGLTGHAGLAGAEVKTEYECEIEWLLVGKATVQTYGLILNTLLDQIIPLSDGIWYWDGVLSSYTYSSVYMVQTSPLRLWSWSRDIYAEARRRSQRLGLTAGTRAMLLESGEVQDHEDGPALELQGESNTALSLSQRWRQFYGIVRESIVERSITDIQRRVLSPIALCRSQARTKKAKLRKLREITAAGLGVLMDEGLSFGTTDVESSREWKGVLERSVALMDMVLQHVLVLDVGLSDFEDKVFAGVEEDPELSIHVEDTNPSDRPAVLARRILQLLQAGLPSHVREMRSIASDNGRPSRLVRFWLPALALLISSSTILKVVINHQQDIVRWVQDLGVTARDFWFNWVVEPVRKIVATIRHDSNSEIAIMSRDSLRADRESLERMVVDFAVDNPTLAVGASSLSEFQIAEIRAKVKEGDVTPVLRAYERDLRKPLKGAVSGDLVRALLIQVQKTKVDLEVAISGIDALLKSQELVFGFVGLTPGILVSIGVLQYLRGAFGNRKGTQRSGRARRSAMVLRRIDRILSEATPTQNNLISYKDHGLLVCEVHVLRQLARGLLPGEVEGPFLEDLDDLANLKGIQTQRWALERIRHTYAEWLNRI
ncbi:NCA2-domain-containing protein [Thozetella sp. PMI_491]|nr:NCA2-domain-containing protein [Thozetella sp. PMI_491]